MLRARKYPIGAELAKDGGVDFRVWAPRSKQVGIDLLDHNAGGPRRVPLQAEEGGYFSALIPEARDGMRYRVAVDTGSFPDPASRFQPEGPHGPSQVAHSTFNWTDGDWRGRPVKELVMYELHLGTFTREGNWQAAINELPELARIGVTMIEMMPIADFPGAFGWGYDGVNFFAPAHIYGSPDDARAFVNRAHELGIAVILDVVYNHFGPDGNYLREFALDYFSKTYGNEWGDALNFDGENAHGLRDYFVTNARYWIEEFHFDGLRFDATQQMFDASDKHVLAEISAAVRAGAPNRIIHLVAENETQHAQLVRPHDKGGYGLDMFWNDDFHHSARVSATNRSEAYFSGYRGSAQEFVSAAKYGFLYQGQWYNWTTTRRGQPAFDLNPSNFINFLENHDQVANTLRGARLHQLTSGSKFRALTALLLLSPQVPMLFQGQEFSASAPFLYFADHGEGLAPLIAEGRKRFLMQFPSSDPETVKALFSDPSARATFDRSKLDLSERQKNKEAYQLHQDLLRIRREDTTLAGEFRVDGAVLGDGAFVLRYFTATGDDRLLIVNLGRDVRLEPAPEPLLAPPMSGSWHTIWSSEAAAYGGNGTPPLETSANWIIPGHLAALLAPGEARDFPKAKLTLKD
ncbi:MAG: malto-oligosyltrehalose trehalohydrolase [Verrucomicrobiota bacterium]